MAPPKLPPDQRTRNGCVSLLKSEWAALDLMSQHRHVSRSSIVREAVREYLQRRLGPPPVVVEPEAVAV